MRDPFPPRLRVIGGVRAPVGGPRVARWLWVLGAVLLAASVLATMPPPARAASVLSAGSVSQISGTTATAFDFSVAYNSSNPVRNALSVWAEAGGVTVPLSLASGNTHAGTWAGSSTLPVGSWQVAFHATIAADPQPEPFVGPIVTVSQAPTPPPTPTLAPTPRPTPRPTAAPTPAAPAPSPPTGATPPPNLPGQQPTQPIQPPDDTDDAASTSNPSSAPSPTGSVLAGTPGPNATAPDEVEAPVDSPEPSASSADAAQDPPRGSLLAPLLFVGGTMSLVGAAVLGRQWYVTRKA
jgi:hypothetical protein